MTSPLRRVLTLKLRFRSFPRILVASVSFSAIHAPHTSLLGWRAVLLLSILVASVLSLHSALRSAPVIVPSSGPGGGWRNCSHATSYLWSCNSSPSLCVVRRTRVSVGVKIQAAVHQTVTSRTPLCVLGGLGVGAGTPCGVCRVVISSPPPVVCPYEIRLRLISRRMHERPANRSRCPCVQRQWRSHYLRVVL